MRQTGRRAVTLVRRSFPSRLERFWGPVLRIAGGAAVAHPDVEQPVGPELELAAVVVRVRLAHVEELLRAREDDPASPRPEADDARVAVPVGVVDVEAVVAPVAGVERNREQA